MLEIAILTVFPAAVAFFVVARTETFYRQYCERILAEAPSWQPDAQSASALAALGWSF